MAALPLPAGAVALLLVTTRLAMLFVATPVFGSVPVPAIARIVLAVGLAAGLSGGLPVAAETIGPPELAAMVLHELIVGGAIAAGLFAGFGAFHFAGRLLDLQIGYGIANLVDLATKAGAPLVGTLLSMLALMVFFSVDGHLTMLRVFQMSLQRLPLGTGIGALDLGALIAQFGSCFVFGFALVAPIVLSLLLVDYGLAVMSRTMPQFNVFVMSLGLKVLVGLLMLALTVPLAGATMQRVFESIFSGWSRLLG